MQNRKLPHHFTASGLVIANRHILLVNHKRIGAWVPPGGHIEEYELPEETAIREILEETGVPVEVLSTHPTAESSDLNTLFLATPLFVQAVTAVEMGDTFYHVDSVFLCRPLASASLDNDGLPTISSNEEIKEARWVPLENLGDLPLARNVREAVDFLSLAPLAAELLAAVVDKPISSNKKYMK